MRGLRGCHARGSSSDPLASTLPPGFSASQIPPGPLRSLCFHHRRAPRAYGAARLPAGGPPRVRLRSPRRTRSRARRAVARTRQHSSIAISDANRGAHPTNMHRGSGPPTRYQRRRVTSAAGGRLSSGLAQCSESVQLAPCPGLSSIVTSSASARGPTSPAILSRNTAATWAASASTEMLSIGKSTASRLGIT